MNIELSKMQLIHLRNICKKGWGGYSKPSDDLEEMVKNGLLTKSAGPFRSEERRVGKECRSRWSPYH